MAASTPYTPVSGQVASQEVQKKVNEFMDTYSISKSLALQMELCVSRTKNFYDLVTDFYQYGWGNSFHFAPCAPGETFRESLLRHEFWLTSKLNIKPGDLVLDLGAGVAGPLINIARFSEASVHGINYNNYQCKKGNARIAEAGLGDRCEMREMNFLDLKYEENSVDAVYAIEATCHVSDRLKCYSEACRVLKPGHIFAGFEWVMTPNFKPGDPKHEDIKKGIEIGNALAPILTGDQIQQTLLQAGFELLDARDIGKGRCGKSRNWAHSMIDGDWVNGFRMSWLGRNVTHYSLKAAETCRLVPQGTVDVSSVLMMAADCLVEGAKLDIFTPCYFFHARKPCGPAKALKDTTAPPAEEAKLMVE